MGSIVFRLVQLQVVQAASLQANGLARQTNITDAETVMGLRGNILDTRGQVLAQSIPVKGLYADPKILNNQIAKHVWKTANAELAAKLAAILGQKQADILQKLNDNVSWVSIAHQVDLDKAAAIMSWGVPGLGVDDEQKRVYPMGTTAAATLGFVNAAGHGVEGVEASCDKDLVGKPGVGQDNSLATVANKNQPQPGDNVTLTLNSSIQNLLEQQSDDLMKNTQAQDVTILAMDPATGKILGMTSRPTFDPNNYQASPPAVWNNRAISWNYEPGSTFKIISGSAALDKGIITPDETFPDPGYIKIGSRTITNWDADQGPHGNITFTRGMELSSNVVLSQVGLKMGKDIFDSYLRAFGFGQKTGIDLTGEESGLLVPPDQTGDLELATMSFGQANMVTPIQLLTAICAVANGGTLYRPYIVDKVTTPDGDVIAQNKPTPVRRVISQTTATEMTKILEQVVVDGTGQLAEVPGIDVAGKSGTAQKVDPKTGQYSPTDYIASFAAYAPAENPKIALLIIVDSPKGDNQGGDVAAPVARNILNGAMQYLDIPVNAGTPSSVLPDNGPVRPTPKPVTPERPPLSGESVVPDLTGLTMRQAGEALAKSELHFDFSGSGLAAAQNPVPGKVVSQGTTVAVTFAPLGSSP